MSCPPPAILMSGDHGADIKIDIEKINMHKLNNI